MGDLVMAGGGLASPSCVTFVPSSEQPTATIRSLTLSNGRSCAVTVRDGATVVVEDAVFESSFEAVGANYNEGTVTVDRTLFRDNLASAVRNRATGGATVRNSTITGGARNNRTWPPG